MNPLKILFAMTLILGICALAQAHGTDYDESGTDTADTMAMAVVTTATKAPYGVHLVDSKGRSLYLFTADTQSSGKSTCHTGCETVWPVLTTDGMPVARGQARAALLGTIQRTDGTTQVTYNGWPLYYYVRDIHAGNTKGQDVHSFGGEWYLVAPGGKAIDVE